MQIPSKPEDKLPASLPPKPYSEYTIFFRLERAYLIQSSGAQIDEECLAALDPNHRDALEFPRPEKYHQVILPPYWYSSAHRAAMEKKRKHKKRDGRMSFKTLSKTISASWRNVAPDVVKYCKKLSRAEAMKYKEIMFEERIKNKKAQKEKVTSDFSLFVDRQTAKLAAATTSATSRFANQSYFMPNHSFNEVMGCSQVVTAGVDESINMVQQLQFASPTSIASTKVATAAINDYSQDAIICADDTYRKLLQLKQLQKIIENNMKKLSSDSVAPLVMPQKKRKFASSTSNTEHAKQRRFSLPTFLDQKFQTLENPYRRAASTSSIRIHALSQDFHTLGGSDQRASPLSSLRNDIISYGLKNNNTVETPAARVRRELSDSFKLEIKKINSFTSVPEWEKEDADTLLCILNDLP